MSYLGHCCVTIARYPTLSPDGRWLLHHRKQQAKQHQNTESARYDHKLPPCLAHVHCNSLAMDLCSRKANAWPIAPETAVASQSRQQLEERLGLSTAARFTQWVIRELL